MKNRKATTALLSLTSSPLLDNLNSRITHIGQVPVDKRFKPQVHVLSHNRDGVPYMRTRDGVLLTSKEAVELLKTARPADFQKEVVEDIEKNPKDYQFAYVRVPSKERREDGGINFFGNLYVCKGAEIDCYEWEEPATGTEGK